MRIFRRVPRTERKLNPMTTGISRRSASEALKRTQQFLAQILGY